MRTRKAYLKTEKISEATLLQLIAQSDASGYPVYIETAIMCTSKRTVCKLFDIGAITYEKLALGTAVHLTV